MTAQVTSVAVHYADPGEPGSPARLVADLRHRTVAHIDRVDVGAVLTAYLAEHPLSAACPATEILRLTALVETVLDQARTAVRVGTAADFAARLLPRLTKEIQQ